VEEFLDLSVHPCGLGPFHDVPTRMGEPAQSVAILPRVSGKLGEHPIESDADTRICRVKRGARQHAPGELRAARIAVELGQTKVGEGNPRAPHSSTLEAAVGGDRQVALAEGRVGIGEKEEHLVIAAPVGNFLEQALQPLASLVGFTSDQLSSCFVEVCLHRLVDGNADPVAHHGGRLAADESRKHHENQDRDTAVHELVFLPVEPG
jgi:hypothetical protein